MSRTNHVREEVVHISLNMDRSTIRQDGQPPSSEEPSATQVQRRSSPSSSRTWIVVAS